LEGHLAVGEQASGSVKLAQIVNDLIGCGANVARQPLLLRCIQGKVPATDAKQ